MWDGKADAKLLKLRNEGLSFAQIAERMGISRNAAIGRAQRLAGRIFPSQIARNEQAKLEAVERGQKSAQEQKAIVRRIKKAIAAGSPRLKVIEQALAKGATYQIIGDALGLSKQRVHQIALDAA